MKQAINANIIEVLRRPSKIVLAQDLAPGRLSANNCSPLVIVVMYTDLRFKCSEHSTLQLYPALFFEKKSSFHWAAETYSVLSDFLCSSKIQVTQVHFPKFYLLYCSCSILCRVAVHRSYPPGSWEFSQRPLGSSGDHAAAVRLLARWLCNVKLFQAAWKC